MLGETKQNTTTLLLAYNNLDEDSMILLNTALNVVFLFTGVLFAVKSIYKNTKYNLIIIIDLELFLLCFSINRIEFILYCINCMFCIFLNCI